MGPRARTQPRGVNRRGVPADAQRQAVRSGKKMKQLLTKFVLIPLLCIYVFGSIISGVYFNWRYARENSFLRWLLLGEVVPTLQGTIWPYYAVKHFVNPDSSRLQAGGQQQATQPPPYGEVIAAFKQRAWWLPEYKQLNAVLDRAGGNLSASYRTGPRGASHVRVQIVRGPGKSLTLILDLPPEAIVSVDPKTGKAQPGKERSVVTYRDHDLDGMPDDVLVKPSEEPVFKETFTGDGYMIVRDSHDHTAFWVHWTIALAFSTNHFLHGKDSASR